MRRKKSEQEERSEGYSFASIIYAFFALFAVAPSVNTPGDEMFFSIALYSSGLLLPSFSPCTKGKRGKRWHVITSFYSVWTVVGLALPSIAVDTRISKSFFGYYIRLDRYIFPDFPVIPAAVLWFLLVVSSLLMAIVVNWKYGKEGKASDYSQEVQQELPM